MIDSLMRLRKNLAVVMRLALYVERRCLRLRNYPVDTFSMSTVCDLGLSDSRLAQRVELLSLLLKLPLQMQRKLQQLISTVISKTSDQLKAKVVLLKGVHFKAQYLVNGQALVHFTCVICKPV
jgi:hypothetical protein